MMFPDYQRVDNAEGAGQVPRGLGRRARRQAGPDGDGDRRQRAQGRRARHVHDGREPVPLGPERQQGPQGARRARVPRRAGHLPHGDGRVRRRGAARDLVPGEGGDVHEHRPARADRPQGARPARARRGPDWEVICEIGNRIGLPMEYAHPREVFDEMVALSPAYTGLRLRQPRPGRQALPQPGPGALRRHRRAVRRVVRDRRRQGAPRARRVDAGQGAARRGVPVRAQHGPAARALAHGLDDAALVRARRDRARGEGLHRDRGRGADGRSRTATSCA